MSTAVRLVIRNRFTNPDGSHAGDGFRTIDIEHEELHAMLQSIGTYCVCEVIGAEALAAAPAEESAVPNDITRAAVGLRANLSTAAPAEEEPCCVCEGRCYDNYQFGIPTSGKRCPHCNGSGVEPPAAAPADEEQPKDGRCDFEVYMNGEVVDVQHMSAVEAEERVNEMRATMPGFKVDWHYVAGRAVFKRLPLAAPAEEAET